MLSGAGTAGGDIASEVIVVAVARHPSTIQIRYEAFAAIRPIQAGVRPWGSRSRPATRG